MERLMREGGRGVRRTADRRLSTEGDVRESSSGGLRSCPYEGGCDCHTCDAVLFSSCAFSLFSVIGTFRRDSTSELRGHLDDEESKQANRTCFDITTNSGIARWLDRYGVALRAMLMRHKQRTAEKLAEVTITRACGG